MRAKQASGQKKGFDVVNSGGIGVGRRLAVVKGNNDEFVGISKGTIPRHTVVGRADAKAPAVDTEEAWQGRRRRLIPVCREKDATVVSVACCVNA